MYELTAVVEHLDGDTIVLGKFITYVSNYPRFGSLSFMKNDDPLNVVT